MTLQTAKGNAMNSFTQTDSTNEMYQFLKKHKLPRLTHVKIDNLESPVAIKEIEFIIFQIFQKKISSLSWFPTGKFFQTFLEEFTRILYGIF